MRLTERIKRGFRLAKSASLLSNHRQFKVGAAIMRRRRPISVGANVMKTHPVYACSDRVSIHAEMRAILSAEIPIRGADIYVYRATARDELAMARPCDECLKVLVDVGIKRIYYTTPHGFKMEDIRYGAA